MFRFTGQPFVDAGIAGMCAAAGVTLPVELDAETIRKATQELFRLMTSTSAFAEKVIGTKKKIFATSEMSVIFPNGPHANPSGKPNDKSGRYKNKVQAKLDAVIANETVGSESCFVSGNNASFRLGNDEFPLVDSKGKRNFHPGHVEGHAVSAEVALALEFFPLSVLRSGTDEGLFWFVHTADENLAIACAQLTHKRMNELIARGEKLGFFGDWRVASRGQEASFIGLIRDITQPGGQGLLKNRYLKTAEFPVTAYVFSNDNRSPEITAQDLPHELFSYFNALHGSEEGVNRLNHEVLMNDQTCWRVSRAMLKRETIVFYCCIPATEKTAARLRGGWEAHALYAKEVMGLSGNFIQAVEAVSERIFGDEKYKEIVLMLRKKDIRINGLLLRLVRLGLMSDEEYHILIPPDNRSAAFAARDYLLAALFEREDASAKGKEFLIWYGRPEATAQEIHPVISLTQRIGEQILEADRGSRAIADLGKANRLSDIRGVYLGFVQRGFATWQDFIYVFPPEESSLSAYTARDYLLAFLYSKQHGHEVSDTTTVIEESEQGVEA